MSARIYARVSTNEQALSGLGMEAQLRACEMYCADTSHEIAGVYRDDGYSGDLDWRERPALMDLMTEMENGDVLVCAKRDRLARSLENIVTIQALCRKAGVHVLSATEPAANENSVEGSLLRTILDAFSEFERQRMRQRIKAAMDRKRARGECLGRVPYGKALSADRKTLVDNPQEQRMISLVRKYRSEGYTLTAICTLLAEHDFFNRKGNFFQPAQIHRILKNVD